MRYFAFAAMFAVLFTAHHDLYGDDMSDYDAIKTTIFNYFDGLRMADRKRLEQAFAVDAGHMKGYLKGDGDGYNLSVRPMTEVVDEWSAREPNPDLTGEILAINIYSDIAATALFDFNGIYTDSFQFAKIEGNWRIVNKFYIDN